MKSFNLTTQLGRVHFALEMYNLASALKDKGVDEHTNEVVAGLRDAIFDYKTHRDLPTFTSKTGKRKRSHTDQGGRSSGGYDPAYGGGGAAHQLKVHGYELVPDSFKTNGGTWEPLVKALHFLSQDLALTVG